MNLEEFMNHMRWWTLRRISGVLHNFNSDNERVWAIKGLMWEMDRLERLFGKPEEDDDDDSGCSVDQGCGD